MVHPRGKENAKENIVLLFSNINFVIFREMKNAKENRGDWYYKTHQNEKKFIEN